MKPGPHLARWFADPILRGRTSSGNQRFAADVRRAGRLAEFAAELGELAAAGDRPSAAVCDALRRLLGDRAWPKSLIGAALAEAAADPFFEPPFGALGDGSHRGLVLLDHPLAIVTASVVTPASLAEARRVPGRRSIGFTGAMSLTRFVKAGGATLAFYAAIDQGDKFCSGTAPSCRRLGRRAVADGEIVAVDGRTESFVIEAPARPVVMISGELRPEAGALTREYDSGTLAFTGATAADVACSRIQLMLTLLRVLGRTDAGDLFAKTIAGGAVLPAMAGDARISRARRTGCASLPDRHGGRRSALRGPCGGAADGGGSPDPASGAVRRAHAPPCRLMARPIALEPEPSPLSLGDAIAALDASGFDPRDEEAFVAVAPILQRLAANRTFLADFAIAELQTRCARQAAENRYGAQVVMIHRSSARYFIRANFWPAAGDAGGEGERRRAVLLRHSARSQLFLPDRRLSRPRLLERLLRL